MQLTRTFNYLWTVRTHAAPDVVLHRNTSRDDARVWRDTNQDSLGNLLLFRQRVALDKPEVYVKG